MNAYDGIVWLMNIFVQRRAAWMRLDTWNQVTCTYLLCKRTYVLPTMTARLSPCRRHVSMANWSVTAPSHLPCQWWAMWGAATFRDSKCRDHFCLKWYHLLWAFLSMTSTVHKLQTCLPRSTIKAGAARLNMLHRVVMRNETKSIQIPKTPKHWGYWLKPFSLSNLDLTMSEWNSLSNPVKLVSASNSQLFRGEFTHQSAFMFLL